MNYHKNKELVAAFEQDYRAGQPADEMTDKALERTADGFYRLMQTELDFRGFCRGYIYREKRIWLRGGA
jgi:hypothetical protein